MQGEWLAAVVAGCVGLLTVGAWAWGTSSGRTVGVAVGAGLVASLTAVFAVSQWPRPGLIHAHWFDWFAFWLLIGGGCVAALVVYWHVHASADGVQIGATGLVLSVRQWVTAMAALATALLVLIFCCGLFVFVNYDGALRFAPATTRFCPCQLRCA